MGFGEEVHGIDDFFSHHTKITGIVMDLMVRKKVQEPVKQVVGETFGQVFFSFFPNAIDDIVSLVELFYEGGEDFGGVLQIVIHDDDGVALCAVEAGGNCGLVSEIFGEIDQADAFVFVADLFEHSGRVVLAPVIYE